MPMGSTGGLSVRRGKRSPLREAAPCLLTIFAFVIPLTFLIAIKIAQFLGYWPS